MLFPAKMEEYRVKLRSTEVVEERRVETNKNGRKKKIEAIE